jgi:transcriptional regulator with XRE-family HTH domain
MKKGGLTLEQERAAQFIALGKRIGDKEIADEVGVSKHTLSGWRNDLRFKVRVMQLFEDNMEAERLKRSARIHKYLKPIYRQILKKIKNKKNLETLPLRELVRMMAQLHNELRFDVQLAKKVKSKVSGDESKELYNAEADFNEDDDDDEEATLLKARSMYVNGRREIDENNKKVVRLFDKSGTESE